MIHNIREAFNELLAENAWMDDETRAVAKEKADAMNERIGYPDMLTNPEELNQEYIMVSARRRPVPQPRPAHSIQTRCLTDAVSLFPAERHPGAVPRQHPERAAVRGLPQLAEPATARQQRQVVHGASRGERLLQPQQERH